MNPNRNKREIIYDFLEMTIFAFLQFLIKHYANGIKTYEKLKYYCAIQSLHFFQIKTNRLFTT